VKKTGQAVKGQVQGTESRMAKFGKVMQGAGLVAAAGFAALASTMKESIDLAIEQRRVEGQLAAVLESTGHAANVSADEVKAMASSLQDLREKR
jgi:hypothetical protein